MSSAWADRVTSREADVLDLVRRHHTNAEIAAELHLSVRTVESHIASLLRKAGAGDRRHLARLAEVATGAGRWGVRTWSTSFLGREDVLTALVDRMRRSRVLSIVGPGGIGKTRTAHELFRILDPGEWGRLQVVDLLPVQPGRVAATVAAALGCSEQPGVPLHDTVVAAIGRRQLVLLLDNAEHLVGEVADLVSRVVARCPRTVVVVTSREVLRVDGEDVHVLGPLRDHAVRLFCDRADIEPDSGPDHEPVTGTAVEVAAVVDTLGGVPLSLELAAARVPSLGLAGLRQALQRPLALLAGGRGEDDRHHSARATVGWSYDLLTDPERRLLRAVARINQPVGLATAAALDGASEAETALLLAKLTEKSLLQPDHSNGTWAMLQVVREYARDTPAYDAEDAQVEPRLRAWAADYAARALEHAGDTELLSDLVQIVRRGPGGPDEQEHQLARAVARLCLRQGHLRDAVDCYGDAATRAPAVGAAVASLLDAAAISNARSANDLALRLSLQAAALAASDQDGTSRARALLTAVITMHRYQPAQTAARPDPGGLLAQAQAETTPDPHTLALLAAARAWHTGDPKDAAPALDAAEVAADPTLVAAALDISLEAYGATLQLRRAHADSERRIALLRGTARDTPRALEEIVDARHVAGRTALVLGRLDDAENLGLPAPSGVVHNTMEDLPRQVRVLTLRGDYASAIQRADLLWEQWLASGHPPLAWMSTAAATAVLACGMTATAREAEWRQRMLTLADTEVPDRVAVLAAIAAYVDARLALHRGEFSDARRLVARCQAGFTDRWYEGFARSAGAELALSASLPDAEIAVHDLDPYAAESDWVAAVQARCRARLDQDSPHLERSRTLWQHIGAEAELAYTDELRAPGTRRLAP